MVLELRAAAVARVNRMASGTVPSTQSGVFLASPLSSSTSLSTSLSAFSIRVWSVPASSAPSSSPKVVVSRSMVVIVSEVSSSLVVEFVIRLKALATCRPGSRPSYRGSTRRGQPEQSTRQHRAPPCISPVCSGARQD